MPQTDKNMCDGHADGKLLYPYHLTYNDYIMTPSSNCFMPFTI